MKRDANNTMEMRRKGGEQPAVEKEELERKSGQQQHSRGDWRGEGAGEKRQHQEQMEVCSKSNQPAIEEEGSNQAAAAEMERMRG